MFAWKDYQIQADRRMEERKQAKRQRLLRSIANMRKDIFFQLQQAAGKRLVVWGTRLQDQCREIIAIGPESTKELLDNYMSTI